MLFVILVLILSVPAVQSSLGSYLTNRINEDFGTKINVEKVGLQFNGDVELKNVYVEDYKQDTLISIVELNTSILNFKNLYYGKLVFGDIDIMGLVFNIKNYKGSEASNLDVFIDKFEDDNSKTSGSTFLLSSSDVSIYDGTFTMYDENKETVKRLDFNDLNINATNFLISGSNVSTRINTLSFKDSRGVEVRNLTTNFSYTVTDMTFRDFSIKTPNSSLSGHLKFLYKREDLKFFTDKVLVVANFKDSNVLLDELNTFYNEFGAKQKAKFSANIYGTLNDLQIDKLRLTTNSNTKVYGDIKFKNLFSIEENDFYMNGSFSSLSSTYNGLKSLLPNVLGEAIPSSFKRLGRFNIVGNAQVTSTKVISDIHIDTDLGFVDTNLEINKINDIDNAKYKGKLKLDKFDLGAFIEAPNLSETSLDFDVLGSGFTIKNVDIQVKGNVSQIVYNNYNYKKAQVVGNLKNNIFDGNLVANDKNLKLNFIGLVDFSKSVNKYDFTAKIDYANLAALNFVKNDSVSIIESTVKMNVNASGYDDAYGKISFEKTSYRNEHNTYHFEEFVLSSRFQDDIRFIEVNSPDIIEGDLRGRFRFKDLRNLFENSLGHIYTNYVPHKVNLNQNIDFNFKIHSKIIEVLFPEVKLAENTFIRGSVESDEGNFGLTFVSPEIRYSDYFANNIELQVDNSNPLFNAYLELDSLSTKHYNISKFNLINVTVNDTLFMRSEFKGGKSNNDDYNLSFYHTINKENESVVGFKKSDFTIKDNKWFINENSDRLNKISFNKDFTTFDIDNLIINDETEEVKLSGFIKGENQKDLSLSFKNLELTNVLPNIDSLSFGGTVNGKLDILQKNGSYLPNSTIIIDDLKVNEFLLGSFDAEITGNRTLTNYIINASLKNDESKSFIAKGDIDVTSNQSKINVSLGFNNFGISLLNPLLSGVLKNIRGTASGQVNVIGDLNKPEINGQLKLKKAGLGIPYLNVDYDFDDNMLVTLKDQSFIFHNTKLSDTKFKSKGEVKGSISHIAFSNWSLDLDMKTSRLLVLDTKETDEALFYGTGFVGGTAKISGPAQGLVINVNAETKSGTVFKIPITDSESFGDNSYIHFITKEEKESRVRGKDIIANKTKGLELNFDLDITEDAEVEVIVDKKTGHSLKGRGRGGLLIEINTNNKFNMWGDFSVFEGVYNFAYKGLVQKEFIVQPGGTIAWEGNPFDAIIRMNAIYKTQANPSPLLDNPINRSIPVELNIALSGNLEQFDPEFTFNFPNVNSAIKSELQYRLESPDDRQNQALYLVSTGSFSRGLNELNFSGTIAERLNGIINGLFSTGDGKLNIGLDYEAGQNRPDYQTNDRFGLTLQTQITDRVLINGKVGVPVGGAGEAVAGETVVAGDVEISFLLNEKGTLTANVFNRENSIRSFGEVIGYTQGLGVSYNVDFNTFKELIQSILKKQNSKK